MTQRIWGYCTTANHVIDMELQHKILEESGLDFTLIFDDNHTEKDLEKEQYNHMIDNLKAGDLVAFPALTSLGRSYQEMIYNWNLIVRTKQCNIKVCDTEFLDTSNIQDPKALECMNNMFTELLEYMSALEHNKIWQQEHLKKHRHEKHMSHHKSTYISWN